MPRFVMLSNLGPDGYATLQEHPERLKAVNAEVEAMGVKVIEQYGLLGQYDFLNIIEAPDQLTMARVATALSARGTLKSVTLPAIPVDELIAGLRGDS
ncbi:MAG: GYD domain-containing protein [Acidimicrobiales bacterium]